METEILFLNETLFVKTEIRCQLSCLSLVHKQVMVSFNVPTDRPTRYYNTRRNNMLNIFKSDNWDLIITIMADRDLSMGPREGVTYPIRVQYCGNCSMPIEYCEYYPEYDKCKQWLEKNLPTEFEKVKIGMFCGLSNYERIRL